MSVPKGKRTTSEIIYFHHAYTVMEKVVKYILLDFGTTKTYRDIKYQCSHLFEINYRSIVISTLFLINWRYHKP